MGMPLAFSRQADFTGMTDSPEGKELYITLVMHKAFVEVAEWGTEAAAATGVVVGVRAAVMDPPVVRVDRPFVFLIHDRETGVPLFLGRVMDPR
jgi:serpin B